MNLAYIDSVTKTKLLVRKYQNNGRENILIGFESVISLKRRFYLAFGQIARTPTIYPVAIY